MKIVLTALVLFVGPISFAQACPLTRDTKTYIEVAVACVGSTPDFSQSVAINQAIPLPLGGECRVEPNDGEIFYVRGQNLIVVNAQNQVKTLGVLMSTPSCYQTDTDDEFYSSWNPVRLF